MDPLVHSGSAKEHYATMILTFSFPKKRLSILLSILFMMWQQHGDDDENDGVYPSCDTHTYFDNQ